MEVKRRRGRPGKDAGKLEKRAIIQIAREMTLAKSKIPSIRRLASELNVDPMAIYYYFANKQELLEAVSISLISDLYCPDEEVPWRENLKSLCRSYISLLLAYPDLVSIILSISGEGAASVFIQRFETCVEDLTISREKIKTITDLLADYIHGFCFAAACNKTEKAITVDMADKPISFVIESIDNSK